MADKDKSYMPQSTAGLIRYYEAEEGFKLKPEHVIALGVIFGGVVVFLKFLV